MIITFLLAIVNIFVSFLLGFLPTGSIPTSIILYFSYLVGFLTAFNWFFPIDQLLLVLGLTIGFELVVVAYHFIMWILKKIPFLNIR